MNKILFLGQNIIAQNCLKILCEEKYSANLELVGLVTNESTNEYLTSIINPNKDYKVISNSERNEAEIIKFIIDNNIDTLISVQHPWIISEKILDLVDNHAFNLHNAKLPEYKGHNTISHAILNGDLEYTTTLHWMVPKVDNGEIAYTETSKIEKEDTAYSLYHKMLPLATKAFRQLCDDLNSGSRIPRQPLSGTSKFYSKKEIERLKNINKLSDYTEVDRKARAFYFPPHEPAYYIMNDEKFYITKKYKLEDK